jgi:rare lipoprotein A
MKSLPRSGRPAGLAVLLGILLAGCGTPSPPAAPSRQGLPARAPVTGWASWYGHELAGRPMANGRPFDPTKLTCASWFYPLGTRLRVTAGARSVVVTVTDRGPATPLVRQGRIIDLSRAAFSRLAPLRQGLVRVHVTRLR